METPKGLKQIYAVILCRECGNEEYKPCSYWTTKPRRAYPKGSITRYNAIFSIKSDGVDDLCYKCLEKLYPLKPLTSKQMDMISSGVQN